MTRKSATLGSGGGNLPGAPVSREEAEAIFEAPIPQEAWDAIQDAFDWHQRRLHQLGTANSRSKKRDKVGKLGWWQMKKKTEQQLQSAVDSLGNVDRIFFDQVADLVEMQGQYKQSHSNWEDRLNEAMDCINSLQSVLQSAEPLERDVPTEEESLRALCRDVFAALDLKNAAMSNGWRLAQTNPESNDLTGFERLVELLKIHNGNSPRATAVWVRNALAENGGLANPSILFSEEK